jgi:pimeloyl-ACP methyl ester carboxylesterase
MERGGRVRVAERKSRYSDATDARIHYHYWAGGPAAVAIVHGNSHCGGVYIPLAESLASDGFTVAAIDLRGHGQSEKPDHGYGWQQLKEDVLGVIEGLGLRDVLYVAHSRGGGASLLAAGARPEICRGVVAYEPTVPTARPQTTAAELVARAMRLRHTFASRQEMRNHYRHRGAFKGWRDDYFDAYVEHGALAREDGSVELACPPRVVAKLYEALWDEEPWLAAQPCDLPVRIVLGEHGDRQGPRDPTPTVRRLFPNFDLIAMAGATHSGPMEQPELFESLVREFWTSAPPP